MAPLSKVKWVIENISSFVFFENGSESNGFLVVLRLMHPGTHLRIKGFGAMPFWLVAQQTEHACACDEHVFERREHCVF